MQQADGSLERTGFFRLLRPLDIPDLGRPKPLSFAVDERGIAIAAGDTYGIVAWTEFPRWPEGPDIYAARIVDIPTAVEAVSDLSADPGADGVRLTWTVSDARALGGLRLRRARKGGPEIVLSDADRLSTSTSVSGR